MITKTKNTKKRQHRDFREFVLEQLQDPELALGYLNECLKADNQQVFLIALKNILEAHGSDMSAIAEQAQISRQNLYRILSDKGNPKLTSVRSVLHAMGLELAVQPYRNK